MNDKALRPILLIPVALIPCMTALACFALHTLRVVTGETSMAMPYITTLYLRIGCTGLVVVALAAGVLIWAAWSRTPTPARSLTFSLTTIVVVLVMACGQAAVLLVLSVQASR